jgi:predicted enzyme related to lactoylglutathione lyase
LIAHGLAETEEFYRALFSWEFSAGPQQLGPYTMGMINGMEVAGIGQMSPDRHLPVAWTTYLATDDADKTAEMIRDCCGTVAVGPLDVDDAGRMAIVSDPAGAVFGIWQAGTMTGTGVKGPSGTPVWNELVTLETSTVAKFYCTVFGYEPEPVVCSDFDYVTLHLDGKPVAALHGVGHTLPRDRGPHWMTYFAVSDTDEAVRRASDLGGHVLQAPKDCAIGRLATVADPEGAVFTIVRTAR